MHGSYNWVLGNSESLMVIGHGKIEKIHANPLLAWYLDLFREQLNQINSRLLIIGYSFKDKHINEIIDKAAKDKSLEIYVIDIASSREIKT